MKNILSRMGKVDHIAIAVKDLDKAVEMYSQVFGFALTERRETQGKFSGMRSAEFDAGGFSIVLVEGTDPESQVCRYVDRFGPGVQHVAIAVDDVEAVAKQLAENGVDFATDVIRGDGLLQVFTKREDNSGMMFEFIQRDGALGFQAQNIQKLFDQLESTSTY
jgi:methylmalonyl-CoA/ethylmalonyl-CoA epimerase